MFHFVKLLSRKKIAFVSMSKLHKETFIIYGTVNYNLIGTTRTLKNVNERSIYFRCFLILINGSKTHEIILEICVARKKKLL